MNNWYLNKLCMITALIVAVSCLRMHENHREYLTILPLKHTFQLNFQHALFDEPLNDDHDTQIPENVFSDLKDFVANDTLIMNRIHAEKPLSKVSADKIKGYFLVNKEFRDFTLNNLVSSAENPKCLDGIKEKSQDKLFKIILDQLDFSTIFIKEKPEEEFTQDQVNAIVLQLKTDKELRPYLQKCFGAQKSPVS